MLIVIDTNVIISAALSPDGVPAKLLAKAFTDHQPVFTSATFAKLESRLRKPKALVRSFDGARKTFRMLVWRVPKCFGSYQMFKPHQPAVAGGSSHHKDLTGKPTSRLTIFLVPPCCQSIRCNPSTA